MLSNLAPSLKGVLALVLVILSTLFWFPVLLVVAIFKLAVPLTGSRRISTVILMKIAEIWIGINNGILRSLLSIKWDIRGLEGLRKDEWYLVGCNHQSWSDIPVTQFALNGRIPLLKFFLKRELIWVPFLGIAWWALDFPFMKRHSQAKIARNPALRGKDLETTRRACEKFRYTPVSVFNFLEGTRFTRAKQQAQNSPYRHLLRPKAGGTAFVLGAMGKQLKTMLDITLVYPDGRDSLWDLLCGRIPRIIVDIRPLPVPAEFRNRDYQADPEFRAFYQQWVVDLWTAKDQLIESILNGQPQTSAITPPPPSAPLQVTERAGADNSLSAGTDA